MSGSGKSVRRARCHAGEGSEVVKNSQAGGIDRGVVWKGEGRREVCCLVGGSEVVGSSSSDSEGKVEGEGLVWARANESAWESKVGSERGMVAGLRAEEMERALSMAARYWLGRWKGRSLKGVSLTEEGRGSLTDGESDLPVEAEGCVLAEGEADRLARGEGALSAEGSSWVEDEAFDSGRETAREGEWEKAEPD
jgi:hypothetical protein